ncbi:MAG: TonB family protein [Blastocatellia bacterium]
MKRNLLPMGIVIALLLALSSLPMTARAAPQEKVEPKPEPPKIIRKSGGVLQTSATHRVEPVYPPLAKAARVSGAVVVEVTVDEEGNVIAARAVSGHPLLKDTSVNAARGWKFTPTQLSGQPVKVIGIITFNFSLYTKEDFERIKQQINETPNNAELYVKLGEMYAENSQPDDAIGAYRQALVLKPDDFDSWMAIGDIEKNRQHTDEAIGAYKQAAQTQVSGDASDAALALKRVAEIYFKQQRYSEAVETYKQAAIYDPEFDSDDHMRLGMAYLKLGDKESAMEQYRKLRKMEPELAEQLLKQIKGQP